MLSEAEDHVWDFTPVIDLIYSLSSKGGPAVTLSSSLSTELAELADAEENAGGNNDAYQSLGNFEKLWNYLGQPLDTPPPVVKSISLSLGRSLPEGGWCSRAELQNEHTLAKVVRWRDEVHGADLDDNNQNGGPVTTPALSKRQKKTKRKQHRELLAQQQTGHLTLPIINTSSDEEPSPELLQLQSTPDRRAVIQEILYGTKNGGANPVLHSSSNQRRWTSQLESLPPLNDRNGWPASSAHQQDSNRQRLDPGLIPQDFLPAAARKANLILRLRERFPLEKNYISSLGVSQDVQVDGVAADSAVHVFVDISNVSDGMIRWTMPH